MQVRVDACAESPTAESIYSIAFVAIGYAAWTIATSMAREIWSS